MRYGKPTKPSKYQNKKVTVDGIRFDSKKEALRYEELKMMERAGMITSLQLQPKFEVVPRIKWNGKTLSKRSYIADFLYREGGKLIVEDVKGMRTDVYTLKRQLFLNQYPEYTFKEV